MNTDEHRFSPGFFLYLCASVSICGCRFRRAPAGGPTAPQFDQFNRDLENTAEKSRSGPFGRQREFKVSPVDAGTDCTTFSAVFAGERVAAVWAVANPRSPPDVS